MADPLAWIDDELSDLDAAGLRRRLRTVEAAEPGRLRIDGRWLHDFASNDYLGLARDPRVIEAAARATRDTGAGATASAAVCGWTRHHQELAEALAAFERCEAVALFPTGFAANLGAIAALVGPGDAVILDRLDHACLVAGARLSGARLRVVAHADAGRLESILERERALYHRVLIAVDGVFSMDGDLAPLPEVVALAERFDCLTLVDEAHGTGVFGENGRGACEALGVEGRISAKVGTLSKALGSVGGFVAGSRRLVDWIHNRAPTFLFSTAAPPGTAAGARAALAILQAEPARRDHLRALARLLRARLALSPGGPHEGGSPIVPIVLGAPERAVRISDGLRGAGFLVPAIRPPTVPRGTSRLRVSLSAAHDRATVESLADHLVDLLDRVLPDPEGAPP